MALTVEDGTGLPTAECYRSIADHDAYHSDRGNTAWAGAEEVKEAAVRKSAPVLDDYPWKGERLTTTQARDWPRSGATNGDGYTVTGVPTAVKDAESELALRALSAALFADEGQKRKRVRIEGAVEVEYADNAPASTSYPLIDALLADYTESSNTLVRA